MNYRKKYELYLGYRLTPDIEVHHIDHNRGNDHVSNLVAIPKDLHREYHTYCGYYERDRELRDLYSDGKSIKMKKDISKEINEIQAIANEYGFHSPQMMYKFQDLANKAIRPIECRSSYESLNNSCIFFRKEINSMLSKIKDLKKQQDRIAQKLLSNC